MTPLALPLLVLAAGKSSRMRGRDKLLEEVSPGTALLTDRVQTALGTGQPVLVALPPRALAEERWALIDEEPVAAVEVLRCEDGMAHSIVAGIEALPQGAVGVAILLADMPDISTQDLRHMLAEFDGDRILRGTTADGRMGHPVIFPARDFPALRSLEGDDGAREILVRNKDRIRPVALPHGRARVDLDTPEDWAAWRSAKHQEPQPRPRS